MIYVIVILTKIINKIEIFGILVYIPEKEIKEWQKSFRIVVSASLKYRIFITFFTVMLLNADDELPVNNESELNDSEIKSLKDNILTFFRGDELQPEEDETDVEEVMDLKKIISIFREDGFSISAFKKIFLWDDKIADSEL